MEIEIKVPSPGESITEVEIETWLVSDGDYVEMDAELAEINSDKATLTVNAEQAGTVQILAQEGDMVEVGQVIAKINTDGASDGAGSSPQAESKSAEKGAGYGTPAEQEAALDEAEAGQENGQSSYAAGVPSPSAEKVMKEKGLTKDDVQGTGRGGRITKADALAASARPAEPQQKSTPPKEAAKPEPAGDKRPIPAMPQPGGGEEPQQYREKMSSIRRAIARRLVSVKNETAMLTTFNEVDLKAIMDMRKKWKEQFKETHNVGLGFMSFFTKAATMALMEFPKVNGQVDGNEIVTFNYANIGIAVSTERGLVVPVIRNAHLMSLAQIEQAVLHFALKARENEISIPDMEGGTFSITNGGVFGSMLSTPIINPPQSAILGMHNIVQRPVAIDGQVEIRPIMYLALSYDHRIVDGKEAVSFLYRIKERLEAPERLLLEI